MVLIPQTVVQAAQRSYNKYGVFASVCIAQWALESAWGKRNSGVNNPFGIKAIPGQPGTDVMTWEVEHGVRVNKVQRFANYASLDDAFEAHGRLLKFGSAYTLARSTKTADDFARALQGHYATDTAYASKLISIMKAHNLYSYDVSLPQGSAVQTVTTTVIAPKTKTTVAAKPAVVASAGAGAVVAASVTASVASSSHVGLILALGIGVLVVACAGYFLYKRFKK